MTEIAKKQARQITALLQLLSKHALSVKAATEGRVCLMHHGKALITLPGELIEQLKKDDLATHDGKVFALTETGRAFLARQLNANDAFQAQQRVTQNHRLKDENGMLERVTVDLKESPLSWLRTRKDKDGAPMIHDAQFAAGEKLRADFTRAQLNPRMTSSWDQSTAQRQRGLPSSYEFSEGTLAAKQRVNDALRAVGPELNGVLLDVCCFLKGLKLVESERRWPARTAKIILSLALDRLAQHYGLMQQARGKGRADIRQWGAEDYRPVIQY